MGKTTISEDETKPLLPIHDEGNKDTPRSYTSLEKEGSVESQNTDTSYGEIRPLPDVVSFTSISCSEDDISDVYDSSHYYTRLSDNPRSGSFNLVASASFSIQSFKSGPSDKKQNSIVTIFSIWNLMMGSALLTMPWALGQAGFALGVFFLVFMAVLTCYTAYRVLRSVDGVVRKDDDIMEFSEVCHYYFGKCGLWISTVFSVVALLGGAAAYWVLMSSFLYNTVKYIYGEVNGLDMAVAFNVTESAICHPPDSLNADIPTYDLPMNITTESQKLFSEIWKKHLTVPLFLVLILFPLVNFKSPTFFTKFNSVGTVSVLYILAFVTVKAAGWGLNIEFNGSDPVTSVPLYSAMFPAMTGILSMGFFLHNGILTIMHNQRRPEHNGRDLSIAYVLVAITYTWIGIVFYITFPLQKDCIESNLLDNFPSTDIMAFIGRILLLFQLITIYPLILYILRVQLLGSIFGSIWPGLKYVLVLNAAVVVLCVLCAIYLPDIGKIIRFTGAFSGLAYIFTLPCLVYMVHLWRAGRLTWPITLVHSFIIVLGVANLIGQFAIL